MEEVEPEEVTRVRADLQVEEDFLVLSEAQRWAWSSRANIIFDEGAMKRILQAATELYDEYHCDDVPLVSIDMKYKLARLSAALALMTVSTTDFVTVLVRAQHVENVVSFIREDYDKATGLTIQDYTSNVDSVGAYHVVGEAINSGSTLRNFTQIIGTFFD